MAKPPVLTPERAEKNGASKAPEEQPQAIKTPDVPPTRKSSSGKSLPDIPHADNAPYLIGPLDVLVIKVWGQQNLTGPVDVAADGNISMPLIGDVKADGLTKEQLKGEIARRLSEYLNNPEVDVQVVKINSKSFFVYGAVGKPGEYPLIKATTVLDAMSSVSGFGGFANTKKIYILRKAPSGEMKKIYFNWKEVSQGKRMEQNIYLQNGDRIFVPGNE
jgi:polysaccharide export outer membrane protein